jgi:MATE family multidrug resistance protein
MTDSDAEPGQSATEIDERTAVSTVGNLVTGDLRTTVFHVALPILLQQLLSFGVGFTDTYLSGRISADATSAIGFASYIGWLASLVFGLVSTGTMALVARHWGANEIDSANRVTNCSMILGAILGLITGATLYFGIGLVGQSLGLPGDSAPIAIRYLQIDAFGQFFTALALTGAAALRGSGNMKTPMKVLGLMNVVNILVSAALVFGWGGLPTLGVDGIVVGTLVARILSGLLMIAVLLKGSHGLKIAWNQLRPHSDAMQRILNIGIPAAAEGAVMWFGQFCFLMIISRLNVESRSAVFAAHIVGIEIEAISYLPAVAWGQAAAAIIGQSLGAHDPDRALRSGHEAVKQCAILGLLLTLVFFFGADAIYRFMNTDPAVAAAGVPAFRVLSFFQIPLMALIVYTFSLRGAGDTRYPFLFMLIGMAFIRLPLGWLFGIYFEGGLLGAWVGMFGDIVLRGAMIVARYLHGDWIKTKV